MVDKKIKYNSPKNENFKTLCVLNKRKQVCTKLLHPNNPINFQVSRKWNDNEVLWAPREEYNNFGSISNIATVTKCTSLSLYIACYLGYVLSFLILILMEAPVVSEIFWKHFLGLITNICICQYHYKKSLII